MGPGLPGVGIASIFYVVAALFAPFREVVLTVRGRSSKARWRMVALQAGLAIMIVVSVVLLYWGVAWLARSGAVDLYRRPPPRQLRRYPSYVWAVFALVGVLLVSSLYALWVRITRPRDDLRAVAAAHRAAVAVPAVVDLRDPPSTIDGYEPNRAVSMV
jgi:hypothetical protein